MLIKQHKSGQATIVLIVVTMMTVLGVAVASSSQSRINLRDTVYSTQALQALSCAEAGADRALVDDRIAGDQVLASPISISSTESPSYDIEGCEGYDATTNNYPTTNPGQVTVLNIPENGTQEFNASGFSSGTNKAIHFRSNVDGLNPAMAVYMYHGSLGTPQVTRTMVWCNAGGSNPQPEGFTSVNYNASSVLTLDNGTEVTGYCTYNVSVPSSPIVLRIRPLYADALFQIPNFQGSTGYQILSTGTAGQVQRDVTVIRFYGQLSGAFDEAIVSGDDIVDSD